MKESRDIPLSDMRREYAAHILDERHIDPDPLVQFRRWFDEAVTALVADANAMSLATAARDAVPSVRTVLLKGVDERGFVFYSNYASRKGMELENNPIAALLFFWRELERQVRVQGAVERVTPEESRTYFHSRPRGSQISAAVSAQSSVVPNRQVLEKAASEMARQFEGKDIPLPPAWGGYRLIPVSFEFWQGRPDRLHDRIAYTREQRAWSIRRLSP